MKAAVRLMVAVVMCSVAGMMQAQTAPAKYFSQWPEGRSPEELGRHLAEHFVVTPHYDNPLHTINYNEFCAWYGALNYAQLTHNADLQAKLIARYQPLLPGGADAKWIPVRHHVDDEIQGIVPLQIAIQTGDKNYLRMGLAHADAQWEKPTPDGLSDETRMWIDDMYMITILQLEAYRATGEKKYLDRAATEMVVYLKQLQTPNGLFFHAPDVQFYWGRGDGWVAVGMTEVLRDLPASDARRATIMAGYKKMMAALLKYQGKDGMWRQLIDKEDAWPESSSSAMFTYAMISGVKAGWLPAEEYGPAARRGWIAVSGYVDQNYDVTNVCAGTGKKNDLEYYYERPRRTGDFHGQAAVMWVANALLRDGVK